MKFTIPKVIAESAIVFCLVSPLICSCQNDQPTINNLRSNQVSGEPTVQSNEDNPLYPAFKKIQTDAQFEVLEYSEFDNYARFKVRVNNPTNYKIKDMNLIFRLYDRDGNPWARMSSMNNFKDYTINTFMLLPWGTKEIEFKVEKPPFVIKGSPDFIPIEVKLGEPIPQY